MNAPTISFVGAVKTAFAAGDADLWIDFLPRGRVPSIDTLESFADSEETRDVLADARAAGGLERSCECHGVYNCPALHPPHARAA